MQLRSSLYVALVLLCGCGPQGSLSLNPNLQSDRPYGEPAERTRGTFCAKGFNGHIMNAAGSFGPASYLWEGDGVTRLIYYQGTLIAEPYAPGKCHCVGATFQVYMTAFETWDQQYGGSSGSLKGLMATQVKQMRQIWYVATSDKTGVQAALTASGLGTKVTGLEQAQQGDLAQLWRNNGSGHSVVFDSWKQDGGAITGITYFSCQSGGPGFVTESIGSGASDVTAGEIHVVHPLAPVEPPDAGPADQATPDADGPAPVDAAAGGEVSLPPLAGDQLDTDRPEEGCGCTVRGASATSCSPLLLLLLLAVVARRLW